MNWIKITSIKEVEELNNATELALIFKHSTRCSISSMALNRLERKWDDAKTPIKAYFLDLIAYRDVSAFIAEKYSVYHESPQMLLIKEGECIFEESHNGISYEEILEFV